MSDPAKNADIEDVLASIRRLVSEGERAQAHGAARRNPGRLILTQAQRVQPEQDAAPKRMPEPAPEPAAPVVEAAPAPEPLMPKPPLRKPAPPKGEEHWALPPDAANLAREDAGEEGAAEEGEAPAEDEEWSVDSWLYPEGPAERPAMMEDLEAPLAEADADEEDEAELDDGPRIGPELEDEEEEALAAGSAVQTTPASEPLQDRSLADEIASLEAAFSRREAGEAPEASEPEATEPEAEAPEPEAKAPEPEVASSPRSPLRLVSPLPSDAEAEPDLPPIVPPPEGPAPAAAAWARALAAAQEEIEEDEEPEDLPGAEGALDAAFASSAIDEAALRRMVTEIIREELQGQLGERITRNVRKLVRREIYRALSSDETR